MVANAMNFMMPPDSNWEYIANLTEDETWNPEEMRRYFVELERVVYLDSENPDHGHDGYITVSPPPLLLTIIAAAYTAARQTETTSHMLQAAPA